MSVKGVPEGTKRFSVTAWSSARNGHRTLQTPNDRTVCAHAVLMNIVSNIYNLTVRPIQPCVFNKLKYHCENHSQSNELARRISDTAL